MRLTRLPILINNTREIKARVIRSTIVSAYAGLPLNISFLIPSVIAARSTSARYIILKAMNHGAASLLPK